jgi:hypothetical protein
VLRAAGETETTQKKKTRDWIELDERDPGFQLLIAEDILFIFIIYLFSPFFFPHQDSGQTFASLIRITA